MREDKVKSEPAFPKENLAGYGQTGMSKRFFAACAAMQGLLANEQLIIALSKKFPKEEQYKDIRIHYTVMAYEYADELLAQENK